MTGFLNIWKAEGVSSAFVVNRAKRLTREACGHMGTLDPLAAGVLPVGVGNANRLFGYFLGKTKTYVARFRFGVTSASLDRESEPIFGGGVPCEREIEAVLPTFCGEIDQIPPAYSAKSVNGQRSYELARQGRAVELAPKRVRIEQIRLLGRTGPDEYEFEIVCGGGTYIRSLARDVAERLGTKGLMSALTRTRSGPFTRETSVPLEALTAETIGKYLLPTQDVLPYPVMEVTDERYFHGVRCPVAAADGSYKVYRGGEFYGTGIVEEGLLRPDKKLC